MDSRKRVDTKLPYMIFMWCLDRTSNRDIHIIPQTVVADKTFRIPRDPQSSYRNPSGNFWTELTYNPLMEPPGRIPVKHLPIQLQAEASCTEIR
jgi:hypothetical protein